jgi:hypothetical protein
MILFAGSKFEVIEDQSGAVVRIDGENWISYRMDVETARIIAVSSDGDLVMDACISTVCIRI